MELSQFLMQHDKSIGGLVFTIYSNLRQWNASQNFITFSIENIYVFSDIVAHILNLVSSKNDPININENNEKRDLEIWFFVLDGSLQCERILLEKKNHMTKHYSIKIIWSNL